MSYTITEVTTVLQDTGSIVYYTITTLDGYYVISDGGLNISLMDIFLGFLILYLIVDRVLQLIRTD